MAGSGVDRSWAASSMSTRPQPRTADQTPRPRSGTPQAFESGGDLHVQAGGLVLAGVQLEVIGPGPAGQQRAVHDVVLLQVKLFCGRHERPQQSGGPAVLGSGAVSTVSVLTEDVGVGGIAYLEMPLGALERGMELMGQVRAGLADVRVPTLLIYGDSAACPCRSLAAMDSDASRRVPIAGVGMLVRRRTGQGAPRRVQVAVDPRDRAIGVGAVDVGEADHRLAVADRHVATLANRDHQGRLPPGCRSTALTSHLLSRLGQTIRV
jgi:hypothetical protein